MKTANTSHQTKNKRPLLQTNVKEQSKKSANYSLQAKSETSSFLASGASMEYSQEFISEIAHGCFPLAGSCEEMWPEKQAVESLGA